MTEQDQLEQYNEERMHEAHYQEQQDEYEAAQALSDPICSRCGGVHANDCDSYWEDGEGGLLCQMCWESVADQMWWDRMKAIALIYPANNKSSCASE
jgi:hypothetical protein